MSEEQPTPVPGGRLAVRGLRGAISVDTDSKEDVLDATRELLLTLLQRNELDDKHDEIVSAVFTTTPDLTSCFPAEAARALGMSTVPLLCASEIDVDGAMPKCIRILLHVNTTRKQCEMTHVYLRNAANLRRDLDDAQ